VGSLDKFRSYFRLFIFCNGVNNLNEDLVGYCRLIIIMANVGNLDKYLHVVN
jgi:hypothetical protein